MYITVLLGHFFPITLSPLFGLPPTGLWTLLLLAYAFIASCLPVTTLLQPRDYINAWQLYIALGIIILGILVTGFSGQLIMTAPAVTPQPVGAPMMLPFLFITIACGAISGFHALVSSGTSAKQLSKETHATAVGYGSMLIEGFLAVCILIAVGAGLGLSYTTNSGEILQGASAFHHHYQSWEASAGLGSKLTAVVEGIANIISSLGIPKSIGIVIMGVFIASFAGTTLDTSTRIQSYIIRELAKSHPKFPAIGPKLAAFIAVFTGGLLAFSSGANGKGALSLWPLFGTVNQLLAALALLMASLYLMKTKGRWCLITLLPCFFVTVMSLWAGASNHMLFLKTGNGLLLFLNTLILFIGITMTLEGLWTLIQLARLKTPTTAPYPERIS